MKFSKFTLCALGFSIFQNSNMSEASTSPHIYGQDNRKEVDSSSPPHIQKYAKSVAAFVDTSSITSQNDEITEFRALSFGQSQNLCLGELENRFRHQPSLGNCTGFYIGDRKLVTAGHCIAAKGSCHSDPSKQTRKWVFGFTQEVNLVSPGWNNYSIKSNQVIGCSKVLDSFYYPYDKETGHLDYAVVELDRDPPEGTPSLEFDSNKPDRGTPIYMLGHPSGIPTKFTDGARVLKVSNEGTVIESDLDVFGGNSGSPIFSQKTHKVIGILVRGPGSYDAQPSGCLKIIQCEGPECLTRPTSSFFIGEVPFLAGKPARVFQEKETECLRGPFSYCVGSLVTRNGLAPLESVPPQGRIGKAWNTGIVEVSWRYRDHLAIDNFLEETPDQKAFSHPIKMHIDNLAPDIFK